MWQYFKVHIGGKCDDCLLTHEVESHGNTPPHLPSSPLSPLLPIPCPLPAPHLSTPPLPLFRMQTSTS